MIIALNGELPEGGDPYFPWPGLAVHGRCSRSQAVPPDRPKRERSLDAMLQGGQAHHSRPGGLAPKLMVVRTPVFAFQSHGPTDVFQSRTRFARKSRQGLARCTQMEGDLEDRVGNPPDQGFRQPRLDLGFFQTAHFKFQVRQQHPGQALDEDLATTRGFPHRELGVGRGRRKIAAGEIQPADHKLIQRLSMVAAHGWRQGFKAPAGPLQFACADV